MKKFISIITKIYLIILLILATMPFWPGPFWWLANLIQIAPFYLLFVPIALFFIFSLYLHDWKTIIIQVLSCVIILFPIMRINLHLPSDEWISNRSDTTLRLISMNVGKDKEVGIRFNNNKFIELIKETQPDIIALQEAGQSALLKTIQTAFPDEQWYGQFNDGFSLISKIPVTHQKMEWDLRGGAISKFQIKAKDYLFTYFNIHFMTPRPGVEAIISKGIKEGNPQMKKVTETQRQEAEAALSIIEKSNNVIISGDFNMSTIHPIFRKNWSHYQNAFSKRGLGFGHSKFFLFHGVRIDHVLCDRNWQVINAKVGPSMDCDHRPLIVDLKYMGQLQDLAQEKIITHKYSDIQLIDFSQAYHYEEFEESPGSFKDNQTAELTIDRETKYLRGNALKIKKKDGAARLTTAISFDLWNFEKYGTLSFSYKIPQGTSVCVNGKTRFGDTLCIAASQSSQCEGAKSKPCIKLEADNRWHEININVKNEVKSLLPAIKYLQELQFTIDKPGANNFFWLDDLRITESTNK